MTTTGYLKVLKHPAVLKDEYYATADQHGERFGQWVVNTYGRGAWPKLYYATDQKAEQILGEYYLIGIARGWEDHSRVNP